MEAYEPLSPNKALQNTRLICSETTLRGRLGSHPVSDPLNFAWLLGGSITKFFYENTPADIPPKMKE